MESIIARVEGFFKFLLISLVFYYILIILFVLFSFFLGRVTKFLETSPTFTFISKEGEDANFEKEKNNLFQQNLLSTSTIVASSGGKKYYFVWCKGAMNIKENKKRYFDSEKLAQTAGYTLAANCK